MENEKNFDKNGVYSKRVRAGKRRTYFFDVRTTRANDYYLTITESKKREDDTYERHKVFIYKEDFMKFLNAMQETIDYIKTDLLPDYDFDAHNHDDYEEGQYYKQENTTSENKQIEEKIELTDEVVQEEKIAVEVPVIPTNESVNSDDVEKWD